MKTGSIYSASDKALFDAINQATITNAEMRHLFLIHGIIISKYTPRHDLALLYSRLLHDYEDFQELARLFDTGQRRERLASFRVKSEATIQDFENSAHQLLAALKSNSEAASVSANDDGSLKIAIRYKAFNFNKSEFRQVETRDAIITVEQENNVIVIRGPQNDKVDEICRKLISQVETQVNGDLEIDEISLEMHPLAKERTDFFLILIESLAGFKRRDVTDVYVYKPKTGNAGKKQSDENDEDTGIDLGVHISRASLKGEGVLESEEMKSLIKRGFYISKVVWQANEAGFDSDIFEFEAQFSEPETCTRFSYLSRGYYKYLGEKKHSKSRTQLLPADDRELSKVIESAARHSLAKIQSGTGSGVEDGKN